jgi:hypothetical protein
MAESCPSERKKERPAPEKLTGIVAVWLFVLAGLAAAAEYHVTPAGRPDGDGSEARPWDIVSALGGAQRVAGGDTVWIHAGKYRSKRAYDRRGNGFVVKLAGTKARPVHVRAAVGARAILDGGLEIAAPSSHLWVRDLEITVAPDKPISRETKTSGSHPADLAAPSGGLHIHAGAGCRFINLWIHDNLGNGVGWWTGSTDGEMYGCVIVGNGWKGPDRNHGHCIYTQNGEGTKTISNCILKPRWGGGQYTMHAYGSSRAYVDNFTIAGNIAYGAGPFLIGGGRPSRGIVVRANYLYRVPLMLGYNAPHNENCVVRDNVVVGANLNVRRYNKAVLTGNVVAGGRIAFEKIDHPLGEGNRVDKDARAVGLRAVVLPNRYDPARAHVVVYNPAEAKRVAVDVSAVLKPGHTFRLMAPEQLHGKPVVEGIVRGKTIFVPMDGPFGAFVLLRKAAQPS